MTRIDYKMLVHHLGAGVLGNPDPLSFESLDLSILKYIIVYTTYKHLWQLMSRLQWGKTLLALNRRSMEQGLVDWQGSQLSCKWLGQGYPTTYSPIARSICKHRGGSLTLFSYSKAMLVAVPAHRSRVPGVTPDSPCRLSNSIGLRLVSCPQKNTLLPAWPASLLESKHQSL